MRISKATTNALSASAALAMLGGCSDGSGAQIGPTSGGPVIQSIQGYAAQKDRINGILALNSGIASHKVLARPSFMAADEVGKPLLFVSDGTSNVDIYLQRGSNKMVGQITGLTPGGLATDRFANLYIANNANVPVYAPPYTTPTLTLDDTGYLTNGVAVSRQGVVGVTNFCNTSCASGTGNVVFYAHNSTTPCATVSDSTNFAFVSFGAFDDEGNLYITGFSSTAPTVGEIRGGCKAKKISLLTATNHLADAPGGVQIDKHDKVALENDYYGVQNRVIDTYDRPKHDSLGNPVSITPLTNTQGPSQFAFLRSGNKLYLPDEVGFVYQYDYPAGGAPRKTITVGGLPYGVAVTPALVR
jgi:hypothetical protein